MSEFKHTPGPWGARAVLVMAGGTTICRAHAHSGVRHQEECEANARLIAAAPEMLPIVSDYVAELEHKQHRNGGLTPSQSEELDRARAVLSRIRGESA